MLYLLMPNIAITKYCNLQCPYCFAQPMLTEEQAKNISIPQLKRILGWIGNSYIQDDHIGLIGGEPTLHPNFKEILFYINEFCETHGVPAVLFTNGIYLEQYLCNLGDLMGVLINVNNLNEKNKKKLYSTLNAVKALGWINGDKSRIHLGCNLYMEETNYSYFWETVDYCPGLSSVRVSVTAPVEEKYQKDKDLYYTSMKTIFWNFLLEAYKRNLNISFDCNLIPLCYFTPEQQEFIQSFGHYKEFCEPTVDITADFYASSCFGTYEETLVNCENFTDLQEIKRYFSNTMMKKSISNTCGPCENCKKINLLKCQGGCLGFSTQAN